MSIGTSLFHAINTRTLSRAGAEISELQDQISSGKNDPRPSADPVRALRLSAAFEQQQALDRFSTNIDRAQTRLDQSDGVLAESSALLQRMGELAIRVASDSATPAERDAIMVELRELRSGLLDMANSRDDTGRPLFGGYLIEGNPFEDGPLGVVYQGDGGQTRLQVSETASIATSLSGDQVFGAVAGTSGATVFSVIDDFFATVQAAGQNWKGEAQSTGSMSLAITPTRAPVQWSIDLSGPDGSATIQFEAAQGALGEAVDAINAKTAQTGITAALDPATGEIALTSAGAIVLSGIETMPGLKGKLIVASDAEGKATNLVSETATPDAQISRLRRVTDHFADRRAELGSLSASAERRAEIIANRRVIMDKAVAGLEDLDIAAAITSLQKKLMNRDATQQAYVKITQKTLFDYIR